MNSLPATGSSQARRATMHFDVTSLVAEDPYAECARSSKAEGRTVQKQRIMRPQNSASLQGRCF